MDCSQCTTRNEVEFNEQAFMESVSIKGMSLLQASDLDTIDTLVMKSYVDKPLMLTRHEPEDIEVQNLSFMRHYPFIILLGQSLVF